MNYEECEEGAVSTTMAVDVPAHVDAVHFDGLARTYDDYVKPLTKDVFKPKVFEDVLLEVHKLKTELEKLNIFRSISVYIDISKGKFESKDGLEVTFYVKEFKRVVGGVNTQVGNNEGNLIIGLKAPNFMGRGERLQLECSYGSRKSNNYSLAFVKPFAMKNIPVFTATGYQQTSEFPTAGYRETNRGLLSDLSFNSLSFVSLNQHSSCVFFIVCFITRKSGVTTYVKS